MKKLLSIILSVTILLSMTTIAFAEEADAKILKVAVDASFEPFEYYEDGVLTGFDIELMNFLAERLGYKVEYFECPFDIVFMSVMSGQSDCAISAITITEERKKNLYFTDPYIYSETDGIREDLGISTNNPELRDALNNQLAIAKASGIVDNLIKKHLSDTDTNYFTTYTNIEAHNTAATSKAPSDWAEESVDIANKLGITYTSKAYMYQENITREEFCELIYNLIVLTSDEITAPITDSFTDTENDKILMLNGLGIINGKSATEFAPNDYLTREEAATIIIRMINKVVPMAATEMWFEYDDINEISEWASDSIQTISNLGFMNGVGNNKFAPKDAYTVEQAIVTLVRVFEKAEAAGVIDENASIGIIGGSDGPTSIIVGENVNVIDKEEYDKFYVEVKNNTTKVDDFYIDEALKLITESGKLAADNDFISLYTTNDEMTSQMLELGAVDYSKPSAIYRVSADKEQIIANIKALAGEEVAEVDLEKLLNHRKLSFAVLPNLINASYGAQNLAALTVLTNSRGYVMPKDFKNDFALYFKYDEGCSAFVTFAEFGDGVISANMSFVINGDKDNIFRRVYEITQGLGEDSIDMALVK